MIQLPAPKEKYDAQNEGEARRQIMTELASLRAAIEAILVRLAAL